MREQDRRAPQDTAVRGNVVLDRTRIAWCRVRVLRVPSTIPADYRKSGRRGKELNLLPLPCAGSALPMSYAPLVSLSAGWRNPLGPRWGNAASQKRGWRFCPELAPSCKPAVGIWKAGFCCLLRIRFARAVSSATDIRNRPLTRYQPSSCETTISSCCRR